ncbi:BON domain-containing protein [Luteimicrobium sp. NPDC057192]|uniref:BON domain-containing protein n=1 Tax=Luteimicrobium sp. NPDC057192 TaxID=3346042 RepID=UPI0036327204
MTVAADHDLSTRKDVQDELEWSADVDAARIGVAVEDGTVTLSGEVASYAELVAAKRAALRVRGVRAVVDDLTVHAASAWPVTETDVAQQVERLFDWSSAIPTTVKAEISNHTVTLVGQVDWDYQRRAAQHAVEKLRGVNTVKNLITLSVRPSAPDTEARIRKALTRNAQLDADSVHVQVDGTVVTLTGRVHSWPEKEQATQAAWASPHVTAVDNRIVVRSI